MVKFPWNKTNITIRGSKVFREKKNFRSASPLFYIFINSSMYYLCKKRIIQIQQLFEILLTPIRIGYVLCYLILLIEVSETILDLFVVILTGKPVAGGSINT